MPNWAHSILRRFQPVAIWAVACLALTIPAGILAYYRIFTGFAEWDDEGTLMMTVRQFLSGGTLYENIRSGYGPVYYFYNWILHHLTSTDVTHNVVRATSAVTWIACATASAWLVWRIGKSVTVAVVTHFLVFRSLEFFANEPGHPQELCLVLLLALIASVLATDRPAAPRHISAVLAGALAAGLALVKINIGILALLAVALAFLFHAPRGKLTNVATFAVSTAALVVSTLLMRVRLDDPKVIAYWAAVTAGVAALILTRTREPKSLTGRDCLIAAGAFAIAVAAVLSALLIQGVGPSTIFRSLVLQHVMLSVVQRNWYIPLNLSPAWTAWALTGIAAAVVAVRFRLSIESHPMWPAFAKIALGSIALTFAAVPNHGFVGFVTPFCWVVSFASNGRETTYSRTLIAALAVLQTLYAYPVAGSQANFIHVLLIIASGICLADGLQELPSYLRQGRPARAVAALVTATVLLIYPLAAWQVKGEYEELTPLALAGAERVKVEPRTARVFQSLVKALQQNCDTFVGYPGMPSLYFWTGKPMPGPVNQSPGPLNADAWTLLLTPAQQQVIVNEFSTHPNGCVVYRPSGVEFWNRSGEDESKLPLVAFVTQNFRTIQTIGEYQLQSRQERARKGVSLTGTESSAPYREFQTSRTTVSR